MNYVNTYADSVREEWPQWSIGTYTFHSHSRRIIEVAVRFSCAVIVALGTDTADWLKRRT